MKHTPPSSFFVGNRKRLVKNFAGTAPIILAGNGLLQKTQDQAFEFRQDSSFWYFTGIDTPNTVLVLDRGVEYLILPEQTEVQKIFDGAHDLGELTKASGITDIRVGSSAWKDLEKRLKQTKHVATLKPMKPFLETYGFYTNPFRSKIFEKITGYENEPIELNNLVARMRATKQPVEVEILKAAIELSSRSLQALKKQGFNDFNYEWEVEEFLRSFIAREQAELAFPTTVAVDERACIIHLPTYDGVVKGGKLLLIDIGAQLGGSYYAADIARCFALQAPTKRVQQVHKALVDASDFICSIIKPGITYKALEEQSSQFIGEKLRELGLIKTVTQSEIRQYFPHATSHFLGLDAHDVGDYEQPLQKDMVVTVEPGIYIPDESMGLRLEDPVILTDEGCQKLFDGLSLEL